MANCLSCGAPLQPGDGFCGVCGAPVQAQPQPAAPVASPYTPPAPAAPYAPPQQYAPQPQYGAPYGMVVPNPGKGLGIASMVLGIVGLVFCFIGIAAILGIICGIVGLILGISSRKKSIAVGAPKNMATAGIIMSIVIVALGIVMTIVAIAAVGSAVSFFNNL